MGALAHKAKKGLLWSSIDKFSTLFIQFTIGIVLARLLMPEDFGLIGMISIFMAISQSLVDSGFYTALVQKKDAGQRDFSTILFFNISVSILLYLMLFAFSGAIARFYEEPLLIDLIKVVSINIIILSTTVVHKARMAKSIDFKTQAIAHISASIISGAIGIYAALNGYGVWALVAHYLARSIVVALLYWLLNRWVPSLIFSKSSFRALFGFGSKLMLSELLKIFFQNLYLIIIGKIYRAEELGHFTRATLFKQVPSTLIGNILQSVTFPLMVKVVEDDQKARNLLMRSIRLSGFILCPIIVWLLFFAKPLILVLLTQKWLPTVVLLQILALDIIFHPIQYINLNFLNAKGRSDLFLKLELFKNSLTILAILLTYQWGVVAMTTGYVLVSLVSFFINSYYTGKYVGYTALKQLRDLSPYFLVSGVAGIISYVICLLIPSLFWQLMMGIIIGGTGYLLGAYFMKFRELFEIKKVLQGKFSNQ